MFDLTGKVAAVIGGTSGVGRAIAMGLAAAGADVVPTGRRPQLVEETAAEIEAIGRRSLCLPTDATDRAALERLFSAVLGRFGRLDILVNSQGTTRMEPTLETTDAAWCDMLEINLNSVFRACQIAGREMLRRGSGRIINIASLSAFQSFPKITAYSVSKAGLVMLTRSLACEWAPHVNVNAIAPGVFRTPLNSALLDRPERGPRLLARIPAGRFGQLEELKGTAVYLASDASAYVTGQVLGVDGGFQANGL